MWLLLNSATECSAVPRDGCQTLIRASLCVCVCSKDGAYGDSWCDIVSSIKALTRRCKKKKARRSSGPLFRGCWMFYSVLTVEGLTSASSRRSKWIPEVLLLVPRTERSWRAAVLSRVESHTPRTVRTGLNTKNTPPGCYIKVVQVNSYD